MTKAWRFIEKSFAGKLCRLEVFTLKCVKNELMKN